jgi:hypothetical protein
LTALARLSCWIPPKSTETFDRAFAALALPLLRAQGWQEAGLRRDLVLDELRWCLRIYSAAAGAGRIAEAGSGQRQGLWFTVGVQDRLPSSLVNALFQDRKGRLWGGTYGKGAWYYDGAYIHAFGKAEGLPSDKIYSIAEDREGKVWLGTEDQGLCCYDGETIETFNAADGLAGDCVDGILADQQGRLWVWKQGGALICMESGCWRPVADPQGKPVEQVCCLCEDRLGRLWIGTRDQGLVCLEAGRGLRFFTRREDVPLLVHYFAEQFAHHLNRPAPRIAPQVLEHLSRYPWPGNVRELEHLVQRALLVCKQDTIQLEDLQLWDPPPPRAPKPAPSPWTNNSARPRPRSGN